MKLLMVPWGRNMGHITRCLAIAPRAREAGWAVTLVAPGAQRPTVEQAGCELRSFPTELTSLVPWHRWDDPAHVEASLQADLALLEAERPDVVVHDTRPTMPIACRLAGVPCATVLQGTQLPGFIYPTWTEPTPLWRCAAPAFNTVLARHGLGPAVREMRELFLTEAVLVPSIPEADPVAPSLQHPRIHHVGPLLWTPPDAGASVALPPDSASRCVIVYGVFHGADSPREVDQMLAAFEESRFHLIVPALPAAVAPARRTAGVSGDPGDPGGASFPPFIDIAALLPHCLAFISHGGHGSCMTSLITGCPTIMLPPVEAKGAESVEWTCRHLEAMGVGRCLRRPFAWRDVRAILEDPEAMAGFAREGAAWRERMRAWDGPRRALELLRELATARGGSAPGVQS